MGLGRLGALYRDPGPFHPARAEIELEPEALYLRMPSGRTRRHALDSADATVCDGYVVDVRARRRFVRMLILESDIDRTVVITPPDQGAVAPNVVRVPEAPGDAAIVDGTAWQALADWLVGGGRLAACSIGELAQLACIASAEFAVLIGEVSAQRVLELITAATGPLRGDFDFDAALQPLFDAAKVNARAAEALAAALAIAL